MGDPLMVKNLKDYLDIAYAKKLRVHIVTSGFLINSCDQDALLHPAIKQINFSLNSFNANSKKMSLEEYLLPLINFAKKVSDQGDIFTNFRLWNLDNTGSAKEFNDSVIKILSDQLDITKKDNYLQLAPKVRLVYDNLFSWADEKLPIISTTGSCHGATKQLGILNEGRVVPCCIDHQGVIDFGNIKTMSIDEILENKRRINMINGFKNNQLIEDLCQRCGYRTRFNQ